MPALLIALVFLLASANAEPQAGTAERVEPPTPLYALPFPVGKSYLCLQGFDEPYSHFGVFAYSVDFYMPIGTEITAARSGQVVFIRDGYEDSDHAAGHENVVVVRHEDGTYARYVHLTARGARVRWGQEIRLGEVIGVSGNSGSSVMPHLHFDITGENMDRAAQTVPFAFKNARPPHEELRRGVIYEALPYRRQEW